MMEIWIGLAHVRPHVSNKCLRGAVGAFVPVVALSRGKEHYVSQVVSVLNAISFEVVELQDIEPWRFRKQRCVIDQQVIELAESLTPENPVAFASFEAYDAEA